MRRYYFAYYQWAGRPMPQMWIEEDDIPIGGYYSNFVQPRVEISEEEFNGTLLNMTSKHPLEVDMAEVLKNSN